jgi:potassium-dependent mechanosensitive channel
METKKDLKYLYILSIFIGGIVVFLFETSALFAKSQINAISDQQWTVEFVKQLAAETVLELNTARQNATAGKAQQLGIGLEDLKKRVRKWGELNTLYEALLSEIQKSMDLKNESTATLEALNAFEQRGLLKKPPYPLSFYDDLMIEIEALKQAIETNAIDQKTAQRIMDESRADWRMAQDRMQKADVIKSTQDGIKELWIRQGLQLDVRLADAKRHLYERRADHSLQKKQIAIKRVDLLEKQAELARLGLAYDNKDLDDQIQAMEQKKKELQKRLELQRQKKRDVDLQWLKIKEQSQKSVFTDELTRIESQLKGLDQWRKTYQESIDQHEEMLRLVNQQQQTWRKRYDLLKQVPDRATLLQWFEQSRKLLDHIELVLPLEQQSQNSLWRQTGNLEEKTATLNDRAQSNGNGGFVQALRQMAIYRLDYIRMLADSRALEQRLGNEIDALLKRKPFKYQVQKLWDRIGVIWNYQVWVIDDRPLTVQKIIFAFIILMAGVIATKIVIHRIAKRILSRPQIKPTTAANIEKLLLYSAYLMVVLFTLRMVNIPLAAFAFLGGAIAIGLGFGAQNLINNFISGFIIMGEQPINIDDLIEVDGVLGQVEDVGARCTRIRTGENIQILVPNSSFLEKNITNWTLSDRLIRAHVTVGVAYGSPSARVEQLLLQACSEFELIRKNPEPFVLFTDFGDNALTFTINFWINVDRVIERRKIESRLRFRIDEMFRQADIVIAFPQRDVHIDSTEPLQIQLIDNAKATASRKKEN